MITENPTLTPAAHVALPTTPAGVIISGKEQAMPDEGYTILTAAAERAERDGRPQAEVEGELVEHHQYRIKQVLDAHTAERASLTAKATRLRNELCVTEAALAMDAARIVEETEHDRRVLADYVAHAPQYQGPDNRGGRTFPFAWGPLKLRTKTVSAGAQMVDEAGLAERYPEYTKPKVAWGDLKKARLQVQEDGTVVDRETGEVLPPELVAGTPKQSREEAFVTVAGVTFDLYGGMADGSGDAEDADGDGAEGDPYRAWQ